MNAILGKIKIYLELLYFPMVFLKTPLLMSLKNYFLNSFSAGVLLYVCNMIYDMKRQLTALLKSNNSICLFKFQNMLLCLNEIDLCMSFCPKDLVLVFPPFQFSFSS